MDKQRAGLATLAVLLAITAFDDYGIRTDLKEANQEIDFLIHGKERLATQVVSALEGDELESAKSGFLQLLDRFPEFENDARYLEYSEAISKLEISIQEKQRLEEKRLADEQRRQETIAKSEGVFGFDRVPVGQAIDLEISLSDPVKLFGLLTELEIPKKDEFEKKDQYLTRLEDYLNNYQIGRYDRFAFFLVDATPFIGTYKKYDVESELLTVSWGADVYQQVVEDIDYYQAQNAMGVEKTVKKITREKIVIDATSFKAINLNLQRGYGLPDFALQVSPSDAEEILSKLLVVYVISFDEPRDNGWGKYSAEPDLDWLWRGVTNMQEPTISSPLEITNIASKLYAKLHGVLLVDGTTGEIVKSQDVTY